MQFRAPKPLGCRSWKTTLDADCYKDVSTTLVTVVEDLDVWLWARPIKPSITDPGCPSTTFDHRWTSLQYETFREKIHDLAPRIRAAHDAGGVSESLAAWQDIFGGSFKAPATTALTKSAGLPLTIVRGPRAPQEQFIDELFAVNISNTVTVECEVGEPANMNRAQRRKEMRLRSRANHVRPGRSLMFKIIHTDVEAPYAVWWKVRNRGSQAAGRERGQIVADTGQHHKSESTNFRGPHYVECYIVKGTTCVAAAHVPVKIDD